MVYSMFGCRNIFSFTIIKTLKAIKTSSYINDNFINDVISRQNFYRHVNIKSMKGISSPSTLGIIRPTILFPESFDFGDKNTLECILLHETGYGTRQHARRMLREGATAAEAGRECGFSDYSTFYKAFKAQTGLAPQAFVNRL